MYDARSSVFTFLLQVTGAPGATLTDVGSLATLSPIMPQWWYQFKLLV